MSETKERVMVSDIVLEREFSRDNLGFYEKYYLSDTFLDAFKYKFRWDIVSLYSKLTEEQIDKHKDMVRWDLICAAQNISFEFILNHIEYINDNHIKHMLQYNDYIDKEEWESKNMWVAIKLIRS